MEAFRKGECSTGMALYMALELSRSVWTVGFSTGMEQRPLRRSIAAGDVEALGREMRKAQAWFGLAADTGVWSCYEAGLDGFWLHRYLEEQGISNVVVDSAAIEVNRRQRRAKTDQQDVQQLLRLLLRYHHGETGVWHCVRVPSVAEEDCRHLHRQLVSTRADRTRYSNRIWGLLRSNGMSLGVAEDFVARLHSARQVNGQPLPPGLRQRIEQEYEQYQHSDALITKLEAQRREMLSADTREMAMVRALMRLRSIGENTAWLLVMEFFGWRKFANRRQVGALAGLAPTPYQSGESNREQGINKAGNPWVRRTMIEIAWQWLRYQPDSALAQWFEARYAHGGRVARKRGCVAVARKLLIALWNYLERGVVPAGAQLKPLV